MPPKIQDFRASLPLPLPLGSAIRSLCKSYTLDVLEILATAFSDAVWVDVKDWKFAAACFFILYAAWVLE